LAELRKFSAEYLVTVASVHCFIWQKQGKH